jgi:Na+/proline symporter
MEGGLGIGIGLVFILGLIAAAYSSADSALTSLTTSFSVDIVKIENRFPEKKQEYLRKLFHIGFSIVLILVIVGFEYVIKDASVINKLFVFAGYTYGPLLGMFGFGILTKLKVNHKLIPFIAIASPFLTYLVSYLSSTYGGFEFGFFILLLNGAITFLGMWIASLLSDQDSTFENKESELITS